MWEGKKIDREGRETQMAVGRESNDYRPKKAGTCQRGRVKEGGRSTFDGRLLGKKDHSQRTLPGKKK